MLATLQQEMGPALSLQQHFGYSEHIDTKNTVEFQLSLGQNGLNDWE